MNNHNKKLMVQTIAQNIIQNRTDDKDWLSAAFMLQTFQSDTTSIYNPYFMAYVVMWLRLNASQLTKFKSCKKQYAKAIHLIANIIENPRKYPCVGGKEDRSYSFLIAEKTGLQIGLVQKLLSKTLRKETRHILVKYRQEGLYALLMED